MSLLILEREKKGMRGEREREMSIYCGSTHSCIYWLLLICDLTEDGTHNLNTSDNALTNWATRPEPTGIFFESLHREGAHKLSPKIWKIIEDELNVEMYKLNSIVIKMWLLCQELG